MHFVVAVIVEACATPHVNNEKTNTKQCNVLQILLIDRDADGRRRKRYPSPRISRCNFGVGHLRLACVYRSHLSRSISTPHSCGGGAVLVLASGAVQGKALARALP